MRFRHGVALLGALVASIRPAEAQLKKVETDQVRLVYVSPSEDYLVPHAEIGRASCRERVLDHV